ncbi:methylase [Paenibacillus sp. J31TS4]|uniref:class I SAM-dependent methyltransferase n=1 Tax=Paenibacillus sp. J31TS4 TaxID=2807195 RepID=UPI001B0F141E|nr:class I SAM-dependent methyltransferase [Paenibacillus sp. J31TS4]GIP37635.1 methylase [Paenibacillus sp. J31TS4]
MISIKYIDMLAKFGTGSAHPGGFPATIRQLEAYPLPLGSRILEVGCGTGRTACHLAARGHSVTAVDLHAGMLDKARKRSEAMGTSVLFLQADACRLPFEDRSFDVLLVESVTNFADIQQALAEYCRVLKPGGMLYERELVAAKPTPDENLKELTNFFGMARLYQREEWLDAMTTAGFPHAEILEFDRHSDWIEGEAPPDEHELVDSGIFLDPEVMGTAIRNLELMAANKDYLGFALIRAFK